MSQPFRTLPATALSSPTSFTASTPDAKLKEFRQLLELARVGPTTYEGTRQDRRYGITTEWLKESKEQWLKFDWRAVEAEINSFPNYHLPITHAGSSFDIHFVALFSERKDAVPILMLHGWPGSFLEFLPILRLLTNKYTPSSLPYHIVVPSLPGYAYSSPPPHDADFRLEDVCQILDELMVQLGFSSGFAVQGGDIGSKLARVMGGVHPHAKAIHLNFGIMPDPGNIPDSSYNALEKEGIVRAQNFKRMGSAYAVEHATRPSTIGLALSTNPLALLAWIGEKFLEWTDDDLPLETVFADVTLYWLTDCFATTLYPYRQLFTPGVIGAHENPAWRIDKPMGFSWFPKEIAPVPRAWIAVTGNLVFFRQHQKGGHFAALENPDVLLKDLEDFIGQVWPAVA